ncbi:MAG: glycosyltransferase [Thermosynechococcaceae cyanobacterium]
MKIALVHDYLTQRGGAERVFELLCQHFPNADVYTSLYDPPKTISLGDRAVQTTILQKIPGTTKYFRLMAPFYYPAFRALDLQQYDLLISSSTSFAKGIRKHPQAKHICFCHNVTRFLWDTDTYLKTFSGYQIVYSLVQPFLKAMRKTDLTYAKEPDLYIANSTTVADRIERTYSRDAIVVNYPIDAGKFSFSDQKQDYYLVCSRLLSYKRVDIIIEAFNTLGLPLKIIGEGPERERLEASASSNIKFLGYVPDARRTHLMAHAQAVLVAALEDYGLVPIEANASGTPVISYGAGGVLDTQVPGQTGLFFEHQTAASIQKVVHQFQTVSWNYAEIREHALSNFSEQIFFQNIDQIIEQFCDKSLVHELAGIKS